MEKQRGAVKPMPGVLEGGDNKRNQPVSNCAVPRL